MDRSLLRAPTLLLTALALIACSDDADSADGSDAADIDASDPANDDVADGDIDPGDTGADAGDAGPPLGPNDCVGAGTAGATARCLEPTQSPEYYVEQALKYFDTLDTTADPESIPDYHETVARWEWPPWLLLTGFGDDVMIDTASALRQFDPSTVPERDCRFFDEQPFARCYVVFEYEEGPCPIYEEFVFNDEGEMTFIEAWSDLDGLRPTDGDRWGEADGFDRLSTRVPGLGHADGRIVLDTPEMLAAAERDEDLFELVRRGENFWETWFVELQNADVDFFAQGCGW